MLTPFFTTLSSFPAVLYSDGVDTTPIVPQLVA